jgi:predicted XRE-type DNA-binding protein
MLKKKGVAKYSVLEYIPTMKTRFKSVIEMMRALETPEEIIESVKRLRRETRISLALALMRTKAGITQQDMAKRLKVSQSRVSKLEADKDSDLNIGEVRRFATECGQEFTCGFKRKPPAWNKPATKTKEGR